MKTSNVADFTISFNLTWDASPSLSGTVTKNPAIDKALVEKVGLVEYGIIGAAGVQIANHVADTGGTQQDAIRHSSWNAFAAEQVGMAKTLLVTRANEFHGQYFQNPAAFASNCTMDLYNNEAGAPDENVIHHWHMLKKSNRTHIFPP